MAKGGVRIPIISEFKPEGIDKAIKEFQKLETTSQKIGFGLQKAFLPATAALGGLVAAAIPAVRAASDLEEAQSKINVIFGQSSKVIADFADTAASSLGQSKQEVFDAAGVFGTFGKAAGLAGDDLGNFSVDLIALASDMASFSNTTPEQAIEALGAALRGESEPIRSYGVLLDDATLKAKALELGIYDGNGALSAQQKILAANAAIFEQTTDAQGDFARTSDGLANQTRVMEAEFKNLTAEVGKAFLPVVKELIPILRNMVQFVADNKEAFLVLAGAIAVVSTAIVVANAVMKAYAAAQVVVKVANAALGTSFVLTGAKAAKFAKGLGIVGLAVAAGAFLYSDYNKAKGRTKDLTESLIPLLEAEGASFDSVAQQQLTALLANSDYQGAIEALGFTTEQYLRFIKGEAVPGMEFLEEAFGKGVGAAQFLAETLGNDASYRTNIIAIANLNQELNENRLALAGASASAQRANVVQAELASTNQTVARSLDDMKAAAEDVTKNLTSYRERLVTSLETTRAWRDSLSDATRSGAESFNDFQVDSSTSIEKFRQDLLRSAQNAYDWQNNLLLIAQQTSPEFATYLADMGLAGADLVAQLANSGDDLQDVFDAFVVNQRVMSRDFLVGFDSTAAGVKRRMQDIKDAVENSLPPSATMYQKAMAIGDAIYLGIVDALNAGQTDVGYAAAALADSAIYAGKTAIDARSPSRVAEWEIGRPIAEGVSVGIDRAAPQASQSMTNMMSDVTKTGIEAAQELVRSIEDQIDEIFTSIGARRSEERLLSRVEDAQRDLIDAQDTLTRVTDGAGASSAEYEQALRDVQEAEWKLADVKDRHVDVTQRVVKAQTDVNEALSKYGAGSPEWAEATRQLNAENRAYEQATLAVKDAESALAAERDVAAAVLDGYKVGTQQYEDALRAVEDAERTLRDANMDLLESQTDLIGQGTAAEQTFRNIASAAGLEKTEIDKLIISYNNLRVARQQEADARQIAAAVPPVPSPAPAAPRPTSTPRAPVATPAIPSTRGGGAIAGTIGRYMRAIGGPVPGIEGMSTPIMAHGGEFVLSADVVDAIKRGASTRGLGRGGVAGGGNVINITVTSADPQAVVDAIRKYNRNSGPAPIKVA